MRAQTELIEWAMSLLCSASPSERFSDAYTNEWRVGLEKWMAEAHELGPPPQQLLLMWLKAGKYRSIQHRHDGTFRACDESLNVSWTSDKLETLPQLILAHPATERAPSCNETA